MVRVFPLGKLSHGTATGGEGWVVWLLPAGGESGSDGYFMLGEEVGRMVTFCWGSGLTNYLFASVIVCFSLAILFACCILFPHLIFNKYSSRPTTILAVIV